ncbi:hypothetical protein QJQ45_010637 [Haematococcus lacustris]|nr:hypothetical protein QJQ45_010637 [Haematococcus lacustris]
MGNSSSFEERVYDAAASNDSTTLQVHAVQKASEQACRGIAMSIVSRSFSPASLKLPPVQDVFPHAASASITPRTQTECQFACCFHALLQKLLEQMESQQPAVDRGLLAFRDGDGRTPLMVATAKNHQRCVQLLLQHGACVLCMTRLAEAKGGTALHEAARNGDTHASVCELLLRYGANPFLTNTAGRTPLDEAMLAGSFTIMDRMRWKAMWLGMVAIKVGGGGNASKQRKDDAALASRRASRTVVPDPKGKQVGQSGAGEKGRQGIGGVGEAGVELELWVFRDKKSLKPSCRVLLYGATCLWATPSDVVLRLHPSHKQPEGDMVARCDRGYCLFLRPVSSATQVHYLDTLVALADPSALQRPHATAPAPPLTPPGPRPPTPSVSLNPAPSGSGAGLEWARSPFAAAPMGWGQEWMEQLHALPGESELDFAARVVLAMGEQQGHGQEGPAQSPPPRAPAPPPLVSQPQRASPSAPTLTEEEDSQLSCVVCLSAPRAVGLLHGSTVHKCVCRECAARIETGIALCPLCRQTVERVLDVLE